MEGRYVYAGLTRRRLCRRTYQVLPIGLILAVQVHAELITDLPDTAVTIDEYDNRTEQSYWVNSHKAVVRIQPKHGAAYYLLDRDADGIYEMRRAGADIDNKPTVWKLHQW